MARGTSRRNCSVLPGRDRISDQANARLPASAERMLRNDNHGPGENADHDRENAVEQVGDIALRETRTNCRHTSAEVIPQEYPTGRPISVATATICALPRSRLPCRRRPGRAEEEAL